MRHLGSLGTSKCNMVGVAQLVEHRIVTPVVVGSIPIVHPIFEKKAPDFTIRRLCFKRFKADVVELVDTYV